MVHAGWRLRGDSTALFARYSAYVIENFGKDVKYWLTINEPTVYVMQGYVTGEWPPCIKGAWVKAIIALRNLAKAHLVAHRALHNYRPDIMVCFAHSVPVIMPSNGQRKLDRLAAVIRDFALNKLFFLLIGASLRNRQKTARRLDYLRTA